MFEFDMTLQEMFDRSYRFLREQGGISVSDGFCAYRGENGRMCAVGCLIPDDKYSLQIEGGTVSALVLQGTISFPSDDHHMLAEELQIAHDNTCEGTFQHDLDKGYLKVAEQFGLSTAVLYEPVGIAAPVISRNNRQEFQVQC